MDFEIIIQEYYLGDPLPKLLKRFCYVEQNGARVINRNKLLKIVSLIYFMVSEIDTLTKFR